MGFFSGILAKLGFSKLQFTVSLIIFSILLTTIGLLWVDKKNSESKIEQQGKDLAVLQTSLVSANDTISQLTIQSALIKAERDTVKQEIDQYLKERDAAVPVIQEKIVYVKKYISDPNIAKCELNSQWVHGHNEAAKTNYLGGVSSNGDSQGTGLRTSGTETVVSKTVNDGEALEVITDNYIAYDKLRQDYIKLRKLYKERLAVPVVIPSGG